jgi:hypothetical protein
MREHGAWEVYHRSGEIPERMLTLVEPLGMVARQSTAELAGFSYLECMCKLFKSKQGLTPGQYRKQSRLDT